MPRDPSKRGERPIRWLYACVRAHPRLMLAATMHRRRSLRCFEVAGRAVSAVGPEPDRREESTAAWREHSSMA